MHISTFRLKLQEGYSADWLMGDTACNDLSMFDCLNIAKCAADRAKQHAGLAGERFSREYKASQIWVRRASEYVW